VPVATGTWATVLYTVATMDLIAAILAIAVLRPMLKQHHAANNDAAAPAPTLAPARVPGPAAPPPGRPPARPAPGPPDPAHTQRGAHRQHPTRGRGGRGGG
ncbi:hypothetical protein CCS92_34780, partial [Methylobacterium radiotolerans]